MSYFDRLGFGNLSREKDLVEVFNENRPFLARAMESAEDNGSVECVWFSDTIIFYSTDDSRSSFWGVAEASETYFDELLYLGIPVRGAMAFGDFYGDGASGIYLGKALVDACEYGEKFNWLGFVLHPSALLRMPEVGQPPPSELYYKRWDAEFKNRTTNGMEQETVCAYLVGPKSIMPTDGGHPYLATLKEMARGASVEDHRRKYQNTIQFIESFSGSQITL